MNRHTESVELAEQWLTELEAIDGRASRTAGRYRWCVLGAATSRGGVPLLDVSDGPVWELTLAQVKRWYMLPVRDPERGERPPSASTQRNKRAALTSFYRWLQSEHGMTISTQVMRYQPKHLKLTREAMRAQPKPIPDLVWHRVWRGEELDLDDRFWLGLCYLFGFRVWEVANLRPEDVDTVRRRLTFVRKGQEYATVRYGEMIDHDWSVYMPKVGPFDQWEAFLEKLAFQRLSDGLTFLSPQTVGEQYRDPQTDEVLWRPRAADITWYNKRLPRVLKAADVREHFTPHQLRHSCGTNLWRAGVSRPRIMDIMNHAKYETTLGYQDVHPDFDKERERNRHEAPSEANDDD